MKYRILRIAFSALCGIACLILTVLWLRSYWWLDGASGNRGGHFVYVDALMGELHFARIVLIMGSPVPWHWFHGRINDTDLEAYKSSQNGRRSTIGVAWKVFGNGWQVAVSLWLPVLISGALAAAPWFHWHFSLRALLIGTTIVVLLLGLAAFLGRK
jgi:hypothetical protein